MRQSIKKIFILLSFFALFSSSASAADVSFAVPSDIQVGQTFEVVVNADTGGVLVNSVDMAIRYPKDILSFAGYKEDDGVVRLWIDTPHEKEGKIYFSGIIPGGVLGLYDARRQGLSAIPLVRLIFTAKSEGVGNLTFTNSKILENDGKGSELAHEEKSGAVTVANAGPDIKAKTDVTPPEPFLITFVPSSIFSKTPSMAVFQASDADSGIKYYATNAGGFGWQEAKSPLRVSKGVFKKNITIRAFDFNGNYRDSEVSIPGLVSTRTLFIFLSIAILGILGYKLLKYRL
jgi:hypothetical protein